MRWRSATRRSTRPSRAWARWASSCAGTCHPRSRTPRRSAMDTHRLLVVALLVPLALDTFVLSAALGVSGLPRRLRLRTSVVLAAFEAGMPLVGVAVGRGVGEAVGRLAGYAAALVIGL